ncbi:SDR family NAD(P)-dependent oxidoreductase [Nocardioides sp.]|uniref:SDR family NAD(P)-dependent oxidoreductase n=1 Tax=Nocardioides sp. TaxID=35761 RepID=UPI002B7C16FE|nr:SDR family NAD(P)-dependent oxidoreductase [Nocardioides sp.]HVX54296.1 SDR family NAD(P)-dependent oxidoreductase [Nocardioides sp.]
MAPENSTAKNWFITGASRGFGREWAIAALERGDRVAATARDLSALDDLVDKYGVDIVPIALDVTDRDAAFAAVQDAHRNLGSLDVVINNAGYGHFGFVEELSEEDIRRQMETNFFGLLWITQAALPLLRQQGSGHLIQVTSVGGVSAFAGLGAYHASKWAVEGLTQALAAEVKDFGIDVTLIEPAGFATDWGGASAVHSAPLPAYGEARAERERQRAARATAGPGDPRASAAALLEIVDAQRPPLRCLFGAAAYATVSGDYEARLANWQEWDRVAQLAQG